MPKFRKKPTVVEAVQFTNEGLDPPGVFRDDFNAPYVITIHLQPTLVATGDWIITEPDGLHHYPCKPEIFAATYDEVIG